MPEITINICKGFYDTTHNKFEVKCGKDKERKSIRLDPNKFGKWLKDRKKLNKVTLMVMGVK